MNKAEKFLKQNDLPLGIDEDENPISLSDDEILFNDICKLLERYASEERKEAAVEFELRDAIKPIHKAIRGMTEKRYDNWLKQKEGKQ